MKFTNAIKTEIYRKASLCRAFEEELFYRVQNKEIGIPVYMSAGQEYISATLAVFLEKIGCLNRQIFIQHRGHSTYLSFGGSLEELIFEILGDSKGCSQGMGGSASIQSKQHNIFGHDGLMGSHGPIAVGACYGNKKFTLCFAGDAAAEEDYFLASVGWASTKKLPIWFIVEDNNLSILTEKKVRRCWEMGEIANAFKMPGVDVSDDPEVLWKMFSEHNIDCPVLFNIKTNRLFWHAGAGIDSEEIPDQHKHWIKIEGEDIFNNERKRVKRVWNKCLSLLEKS